MKTPAFTLAALAGMALTPSTLAQITCTEVGGGATPPNCIFNRSFEEPRASNQALPARWRSFNTAIRRYVGDGLLPEVTPRTGIAAMELPSGFDFAGFDTDLFASSLGLYYDPKYDLNCGTMQACAWYLSPVGQGLQDTNGGLKVEFRRPDLSVYDYIEELTINNSTGYADGTWKQICLTFSRADWDFVYNRNNNGVPYDLPPNRLSILPLRFAPGTGGTGTIFWDDVTYEQYNSNATSFNEEIWDDKNVAATARRDATITEPAIPVFLDQVNPAGPKTYRVGNGCNTASTYQVVEVSDRTPTSNGFPLTYADIVANGYVRASVQKTDGSSSSFGTSAVGQPGVRFNGNPITVVPTMTEARVQATWTAAVEPETQPGRALPFGVQNTAAYGAFANLTSTRVYPDPVVGTSKATVMFNFTAASSFTLPTGRGNDAFRLAWLSSMLATQAGGQYDANYIAVSNGSNTRTLRIPDAPRNAYLFPSPVAINVGDTVTLYKDTAASWNPGSPTVALKLIAVSGATGGLGIQGFLASSTDPNDDSLSVWVEWTGAPSTVTAGTNITATFELTATNPTPKGDGNHDGAVTCADVDILNSLFNQTTASATFNAYVDMNNDGVINTADHTALNALAGGGCAPPPANCIGDFNNDGVVNTADLTTFLGRFGQTVTPGSTGDFNNDGIVNTQDLTTFLGRFGQPC
ncbi:MAG: hypothetical protein J0L61_03665 [Planctomycetes bacterium]|nr:hypothetical protein [Planctomycetota bacterium]